MTRVAVVTGSNQGIGLAIIRALCKQYDGNVYLTARNTEAGLRAVEQLKTEGLNPKFHQLDVTDNKSIADFKTYLHTTYGGLDLLINNAAIAFKPGSPESLGEQAEVTFRTNYWGLLHVCEQLFPLLRSHARVVNIASKLGEYGLNSCSPEKKSQLLNCKSISELGNMMETYVKDAKECVPDQRGWANSPEWATYSVSKIGVILLTKLQQAEIDKDASRQDIVINSCCPGYVATNINSYSGFLTTEQGAVTPTFCALLPPGTSEPRGEFLSEMKVVPIA